eukprot:Awhi_evm2s7782
MMSISSNLMESPTASVTCTRADLLQLVLTNQYNDETSVQQSKFGPYVYYHVDKEFFATNLRYGCSSAFNLKPSDLGQTNLFDFYDRDSAFAYCTSLIGVYEGYDEVKLQVADDQGCRYTCTFESSTKNPITLGGDCDCLDSQKSLIDDLSGFWRCLL